MSLFKSLPSEIPDTNLKVSVGVVIRKVTSYLHAELIRIIKELALMNNIENKKNTLQILVREFHNAIKKLHKFVKNVKSFNKISKLDKLAMILFEFNVKVVESVDQLYYTNEMCKSYRIPAFDLYQSAKVINNASHPRFKKKIAAVVNNVAIQEKKEKVFYFLENFFYCENLNEKDTPTAIERMKKESLFELNLASKLLKLQNLEKKEFVCFKNDQFIFKFGEIVFKMTLFTYEAENNFIFSYYCSEIKLSDSQKYFIKTTEWIAKYISYLNDNIIFQNIKISIPKENEEVNLNLEELQNILRNFTCKYIFKNVFKQIKSCLKEYISKKIKFPFKIISPSNSTTELSICLEYEIKCLVNQDFILEIKIDPSDSIDYFKMNFSHSIINESPLIMVKNSSIIVYFNQLGKINIEKIICQKIREFEKIHIYSIYDKLKKIKSLLMPFKICINENNSKISFYYKPNFLLFSIINDLKGNIQIVDDCYIFKSTTNKENSVILREFIIYYLKYNIDENTLFQFNEFVFKNFVYNYFSMFHMHINYENYDQSLIDKKIILKFFIFENKFLNRRVYIKMPINILTGNRFTYSDITLDIMGTNNTDEIIFTLPISQDEINKELRIIINNNSLSNTNPEIEYFEIKTLNRIHQFYNYIQTTYEDFLRNIIESLNFANNISFEKENLKLKINIKDNLLVRTYIEAENIELLDFYFKEIQIEKKNLIFKILCNEDNLKSKFPQLNDFSIMDTDNIIFFNTKDYSINFYFLTKMAIKTINDSNYYKRFFIRILNKLLHFIKKVTILLNSTEMTNIINQSDNILISPIGFQFKYNFFNAYSKSVIVQFMNVTNSDKKNMRCHILPLEYHLQTIFTFDVLYKQLHDCDESNFISNLNYFLFFSFIYDKLSKKFSTYTFPIGANTYDLVNSCNRIFVFLKDHKTFHLIKHNKLSLFIEVVNTNTIHIYSKLFIYLHILGPYLWNSENCSRFINLIKNNNTRVGCDISRNNNNYSAANCVKEIIALENNPINLLLDLDTIFNHLELF